MSRKLIIVLTLLVALPLAALIGLGWRLALAEQVRNQQQIEDLLTANLVELDRDIANYFDRLEDRLLELEVPNSDPLAIREIVDTDPVLDQIVVMDAEGQLLYPAIETLSQRESRYLLKIEPILTDRSFLGGTSRLDAGSPNSPSNDPMSQQSQQSQQMMSNEPSHLTPSNTPAASDYGWYTWYWGNGMQLIHWRRLDEGRTVLIGIQRARWMADVIAELPDSVVLADVAAAPIQIRLVDSDEDVIYQWGASPGTEGITPLASLHLSSPLKPWQLQHFGPVHPIQVGSFSTRFNILLGGVLLALGILGLAVYLGREMGRESREARERVNFVNQVSHELKTPLTNIRMYAELLSQDLQRIDPDDERAMAHVSVITGESSRLSRMINNVLTFAGRSREDAKDRRQQAVVDEVIRAVVAQFQPSLESAGLDVVFDLDATQVVRLDVDALEQMLGNLINNAEKYAASGKHLRIRSRHQNEVTIIDVSDAGPGIPASFAKQIFKPFERASDHIHAATGTGIGLTITRSLARKHGGDLELVDAAIGATFRLTIQTPLRQLDSEEPARYVKAGRIPRDTKFRKS